MKSKLSHPAVIIAISVLLSQISGWTINTVAKGIDEVRRGDTPKVSLASFEPFARAINIFFKPYTLQELDKQDPVLSTLEAAKQEDVENRLFTLEKRLQDLDGKVVSVSTTSTDGGVELVENKSGKVFELRTQLDEVESEQQQQRKALKAILRMIERSGAAY